MFAGFIHPALAFGTLLAAVPLLIHLLNRQRHQPLQWAAMKFVMAAYRRTRRRAQLENLILLLLRMGAVALLALAVARPFTGKDSPLAPLTESRRDLVLVLDASASTGYREGVDSVYDSILARAREILGELEATRGDRVRLVHAAGHARVLPTRSPADALAILGTLTAPADEELDLAAALGEVATLAEEEALGTGTSSLEVRLLTDLQRRSLSLAALARPGRGEEGSAPLARVLDRLKELELRVLVEDFGPADPAPANLGIESVAPLGTVFGAGLPIEIAVQVRNHGSAGRGAVRVALSVDGERLPSRKLDLAARSQGQVVFPVLFDEGGFHTLEASLEGDHLAVDDTRTQVVLVPPPARVLLVDGDPHEEIDRDEVGYWRTVLAPPDDGAVGAAMGSYAPFVARTVNAVSFEATETDLADVDVIVLANVGSLSPRTVERLEQRVAAGASLIVALGDRLRDASAIEALNARAWKVDGTGLLPARLLRAVEVKTRADRYYVVSDFEEQHPILSFFADEKWLRLLTKVPIYGFVASEPAEGAAVLARLDDQDQSPLLVEKPYDRGRVFLWTTSIDAGWNRIPESPGTLIPLVHEFVRYAATREVAPRNVRVGAALVAEVPSFPRDAVVVHPDGTRAPLAGASQEVIPGTWALPPIHATDRVGRWSVELEGQPDVVFSVQLEAAEGDLERILGPELEAEHAVWLFHERGDRAGADPERTPERGELWRPLAFAALAFLVGETLWAAWIGRGRRIA